MSSEDAVCLTDILPAYYGRLFPGELMYRWLSYGDADLFSRREFSFALVGDVYIRYRSFISDKDFVAELQKRKPEKIDIGAVYNQKPNKRDTLIDFIPLQKEFVLDIDLTDYDDVRTCCSGAKVCEKCWKFIALAVKILDAALRNDFGFEHLLWVFSGRRGVHCWICDDAAINLTPYGRAAILEYLTVIRGGENQAKKVNIANVDKLHPFLTRSISLIDEVFEEICHDDQTLLEKGDKNFDMLPDNVKEKVRDSADRFNDVIRFLNDKEENKKKSARTALVELKLQLCFPRLDVNVSKDLNHLLKSPFCIHPKTGKVCVPFNPDKVSGFELSKVPSITQLLEEINLFDKSQSPRTGGVPNRTSSKPLEDYKKTSLAPFIKIFERFVTHLEKRKVNVEETVAGAAPAHYQMVIPKPVDSLHKLEF